MITNWNKAIGLDERYNNGHDQQFEERLHAEKEAFLLKLEGKENPKKAILKLILKRDTIPYSENEEAPGDQKFQKRQKLKKRSLREMETPKEEQRK